MCAFSQFVKFVTLGNDSGADGESGFDGVRDIVMHAGVRDDAGETIGTRGYVYSGADGSFLFTFTAADEPDPPCCGGGGDTEPIGPIDPDGLINTIIDNMGMEGATLAHGDLDGTSVVTTDDLILAIEWIATGELPGGAAAATSQDDDPTSGGSVNCLEAGGVDENGEPCADPDGPGGGGGNPNPDDDDAEGSFFDDCRDLWADPQNFLECILWAMCTAAHEEDGLLERLDDLNDQKDSAQKAYDDATGPARSQVQAAVTAASQKSVTDSNTLAKKTENRITVRGTLAVGATVLGGALVVKAAAAKGTAAVLGGGVTGLWKTIKGVKASEGVGAAGAVITAWLGVEEVSNWLAGKSAIDGELQSINQTYSASVAGPARSLIPQTASTGLSWSRVQRN